MFGDFWQIVDRITPKNISIEDKVGTFFLLYENKKPTTTKKDKVRIDS